MTTPNPPSAELLSEAIETAYGHCADVGDMALILEAARKYHTLAPLLAELVEARKMATDGKWSCSDETVYDENEELFNTHRVGNAAFTAATANIAARIGEILNEK